MTNNDYRFSSGPEGQYLTIGTIVENNNLIVKFTDNSTGQVGCCQDTINIFNSSKKSKVMTLQIPRNHESGGCKV
jgi:hypothetical protein